MGKLKVTLTKSVIGRPEKQRKIIKALGLRKLNQSVIHDNTPSIKGMIHKTSHLLEVSEVLEG